jgi:hypothetical protein
MNKHAVIQQFNKRSNLVINAKELELIDSMKGFSSEKICSAFSTLTGRDMGLKDLELLLLIIELAEALTPMPMIRQVDPFNPGTGTPRWPSPGTIMCSSDEVLKSVYEKVRLN